MTFEEYLAGLPEERRPMVEAVRRVILEHLRAGYVETVSPGMVTYDVPLETYPDTYNRRPLNYVALASQKQYVSLYLMGLYAQPDQAEAFERPQRLHHVVLRGVQVPLTSRTPVGFSATFDHLASELAPGGVDHSFGHGVDDGLHVLDRRSRGAVGHGHHTSRSARRVGAMEYRPNGMQASAPSYSYTPTRASSPLLSSRVTNLAVRFTTVNTQTQLESPSERQATVWPGWKRMRSVLVAMPPVWKKTCQLSTNLPE